MTWMIGSSLTLENHHKNPINYHHSVRITILNDTPILHFHWISFKETQPFFSPCDKSHVIRLTRIPFNQCIEYPQLMLAPLLGAITILPWNFLPFVQVPHRRSKSV
jgi:hypothetical protein